MIQECILGFLTSNDVYMQLLSAPARLYAVTMRSCSGFSASSALVCTVSGHDIRVATDRCTRPLRGVSRMLWSRLPAQNWLGRTCARFAILPQLSVTVSQRLGPRYRLHPLQGHKSTEKKRKDYTFWCHFNEKPSTYTMLPNRPGLMPLCAVQEVEVLKSVSYDRNVVQFYGTCPYGNQTMLVFEYMEVLPAAAPSAATAAAGPVAAVMMRLLPSLSCFCCCCCSRCCRH